MKNACLHALLVSSIVTLAGCAPVELHQDNKPVQLLFSEAALQRELERDCVHLGLLISSYGRWYNYLFISNTKLTQGAIDDMINKANQAGANVVYITNIDFGSSVTFIGQAHDCRSNG